MYLVTAKQMQDMDGQTIKDFGIPGLVLMENAGRGAVSMLFETWPDLLERKVAVLAGRGNNGGDGFVIARYLMEKGISVNTFLLSTKDKVKGDAKTNMNLVLTLCRKSGTSDVIEIADEKTFRKMSMLMRHHDLFVDALLGTGLNSDVRGLFKTAIELMNQSPSPVFSVDIPSGLNSDTGRPMGTAVRADATATFAFAKAGQILYPGNEYTGTLDIIDIGIPGFIEQQQNLSLFLLEKEQVASWFAPRKFDSHKGSFGHLAVAAGSPGKTGAAGLCANAAARCGTGLVTLAVAAGINGTLEPQVIEPMTVPLPDNGNGILSTACLEEMEQLLKGKQALAIGPGIGTHEDTVALVSSLVPKCPVPIVIDADGLNCLAEKLQILNKKNAPAILTPHPGEMARLCGVSNAEIQEDRIRVACEFAAEYDVILILKGAQTLIAMPDGRCAVNPTGNPGMASGGMGDVLTGMIAGFCAQGMPPEKAAMAGVFIHGLCADHLEDKKGAFGFLASDMVFQIPETIHQHLL